MLRRALAQAAADDLRVKIRDARVSPLLLTISVRIKGCRTPIVLPSFDCAISVEAPIEAHLEAQQLHAVVAAVDAPRRRDAGRQIRSQGDDEDDEGPEGGERRQRTHVRAALERIRGFALDRGAAVRDRRVRLLGLERGRDDDQSRKTTLGTGGYGAPDRLRAVQKERHDRKHVEQGARQVVRRESHG